MTNILGSIIGMAEYCATTVINESSATAHSRFIGHGSRMTNEWHSGERMSITEGKRPSRNTESKEQMINI